MALKKVENMQFEESISELENIVLQLEQGDLPLTDALKQFERGIALARSNSQKLNDASQEVHILMEQGTLASLQNFSE